MDEDRTRTGRLRGFLARVNPFQALKPKSTLPEFAVESLSAQIHGKLLTHYSVGPAEVFVSHDGKSGYYEVSEPGLSEREKGIYRDLFETFIYTLEPEAVEKGDVAKYIEGAIWRAAEELGLLDEVRNSFSKYRYFIERDSLGYGKLHIPMLDPDVAEITVVGYAEPAYVVHRKFPDLNWLRTNIHFSSEFELQNFNLRLAQKLGKSLTAAVPMVDVTTPEGHRVSMTFGDEITHPGSTLSLRKFPSEPYSLAYLIARRMLSPLMAAYLWQVLEMRGFVQVLGTVGGGKSVDSREPTLAIVDGEAAFSSFEELWSKTRDQHPPVMTLCLDGERCAWREVKSFIRLKSDGAGRLITLKDGRKVTVTPDHSLVVLTPQGTLSVKRPDELGEGDRLPVPDKIDVPPKPLSLHSLLSSLELPKNRLYVPKSSLHLNTFSVPKKELVKRMGYKTKSLTQMSVRLESAVKLWESAEFPQSAKVHSRTNRSEVEIPALVESDSFARLLGYYIADGHGDGSHCCISTSKFENVLATARELGIKVFVVKDSNHPQVPRVVLPSVVSSIILGLGCGRKAGEKELPSIYWRMEKGWKRQLLRAYLDFDGWVEDHEIVVCTKSFALSRQLLVALLEWGIMAHRHEKSVNGNTYYNVVIPGYFAEDFKKHIGFSDERKSAKLNEMIQNRRHPWSKYHVVPKVLLEKCSGELAELTKKSPILGFTYNNSAISKKALLKALQRYDPERRLQRLWEIAEGNIVWVPVKKVSACNISEYVYDLSVPSSETFLAGDGILVHNTTLMQSLLSTIDPNAKVITVEDVMELRLPHENWHRFHTRPVHFATSERFEVDLFDLIKLVMRHRPDYVAVGEVRGEEIKTLTHAASLGHSCACLPSEELIFFKDDSYRLAPIEKLVENVLSGKVSDPRVFSFDSFGKVVESRLKRVFKVPSTDILEEIVIEGGKCLRVSPNHPMLILSPQGIVEKRADEISEGDLVPILKRLPVKELNRELDLIKILSDEDLYVKPSPAVKALVVSKKYQLLEKGYTIYNIYDWGKRGAAMPLKAYLLVEGGKTNLRKEIKIQYGKRGKKSVPAILPLDSNLGKIFGYYLADGFSAGVACIAFGKKKVLHSRDLCQSLEKLEIPYSVIPSKAPGVIIGSKVFALFLRKTAGGDSYNKKIPDFVFGAPEEFRKFLVFAYWRTDGHIRPRGKDSLMCVASTVSKELAFGLQYLLKTFGVDTSLRFDDNSRGFSDSCSCYELQVLGGNSLKIFAEIMGRGVKTASSFVERSPNSPSSDIYFAKVKARREIRSKQEWLYDVETEYGNFLHSGTVFTHNSTFHSFSPEAAIARMRAPPMDLKDADILQIWCMPVAARLIRPTGETVYRVNGIYEVNPARDGRPEVSAIFRYNIRDDTFHPTSVQEVVKRSRRLREAAEAQGLSERELAAELQRKVKFLEGLVRHKEFGYAQYVSRVREFYSGRRQHVRD